MELPTNKISVYLVKDGFSIDDICSGKKIIEKIDIENGCILIGESKETEPKWMSTFFKMNNGDVFQSTARVVLIRSLNYNDKEYLFVIPFGRGKDLIDSNLVEEQFGIKVLLNSINENHLRKVVKANVGGNQKASQEQIPKGGRITDFGFDIESDLLRSLSAKSDDEMFNGNIITGSDMISANIKTNIDYVDEFLEQCIQKYLSDNYKKNFDWIGNLKKVSNKTLIDELNNEMINMINKKEYDCVWIAVPEVLNWEDISGFKFTRSKDLLSDIELEKYLDTLKEKLSIEKLKNDYVRCFDHDNNIYLQWRVINCMYCNLVYNGKTYCMNFGKWYEINNDFAKTVNDEYEKIPISTIKFPNSNYRTEDEYNLQFCNTNSNCVMMHKKGEISYGGGSGNKIEVCDILTKDKRLIHIKKSEASNTLSHLFNQALISAEVLKEENFRKLLADKLSSLKFDDYIDDKFDSRNYTIVLGVITNKISDRPHIPFFSKVSIRYLVKSLNRLDYNFEIANIYDER